MIILPLPPVGINHAYLPRKTKKSGYYRKRELKDWEDECLWLLKKKKVKPVKIQESGNLCVNLCFYYENNRIDIDSRIKFVLDVLERSGLYANDRQITDLIVAKRIVKEEPRVEIEVY